MIRMDILIHSFSLYFLLIPYNGSYSSIEMKDITESK